MLRITLLNSNDSPAIVKLEGKLLEPWISELQDACRTARKQDAAATLDVAGLSYIDAPGTIALRDLMRRGVAAPGLLAPHCRITQGDRTMIAFADEARPIESPSHERQLARRRPAADLQRSRETSRLARLRAGDEAAYDALVREYGSRMLAVARRMLRSEEDAADAVQDAFVSAFAAIDRFRGGSSLYTWLHRIVVNACLMRLRTRGRRSDVSLESLLPTFDESGRHSRSITSLSDAAPKNLERAEVRAAVCALGLIGFQMITGRSSCSATSKNSIPIKRPSCWASRTPT